MMRVFRCSIAGSLAVLISISAAALEPSRRPLDAAADLTIDDRAALLERMTLPPSYARELEIALRRRDAEAFDQLFLDYTRYRHAPGFFFRPADVPDYLAFIRQHLGADDIVARADLYLADLYPEQDGATQHVVRIAEPVDWNRTTYSANPETIHTLNRHRHWVYLAMACRLTGDERYARKVVRQLSDWSAHSPPLDDPESWRQTLPRWWLMDAAVRADTWLWTFPLLLDTDAWTPLANTLFWYKLCQHGEYLAVVTSQDVRTNHALVHGQGLLMIGNAFPEFIDSVQWQERGRQLLYLSMDSQLFADGCNGEQSPNYAVVIVTRLLELLWLDQQDGTGWSPERIELLTRAVESYYQLLSPDGNNPALSDSYRSGASTLFLEANLVLGGQRWPAARPRHRDIWIFGPERMEPFMDLPRNPRPSARGKTFAMRESGNYVMRSGDDPDARQVIFDAGPKGGLHGHLDLLSFELFGYGRPLIADPGLLRYDTSDDRWWIQSTPAHNTISADGVSHGPLEGAGNPAIIVDQWDVSENHVQITAHHFGYGHLPGRPVLARSLWYDLDSTIVVVDWCESVEEHEFTTSFTVPGTAYSIDVAAGVIQSTHSQGGNVRVQAMLRPGQQAAHEERFTSSQPPPNEKDDAQRFTVAQRGKFVVFATLITAYPGDDPPETTAELVNSSIVPGEAVVVRLKRAGETHDITFRPPQLHRLDSRATTRGTSADLAFDQQGRLHHVFFDGEAQRLKYTVRERSGEWSIVETIDAARGSGANPSIAVDSAGRIGVAYTDTRRAGLKFAIHDGSAWTVETVDARGSTGHYPSLAFSRRDGAAITYYDRSSGDLRMASMVTGGWLLQTIDEGDVGDKDVGRFSRLALDPTRTDASKWVIVYEDTSGRRYRCAVQGLLRTGEHRNGYTLHEVNTSARRLGGFTSLAFDPQDRPVVALYDALRDAIIFSSSSGDTNSGIRFDHVTVARDVGGGDCTSVWFDSTGRPNVLYADRSRGAAIRARGGEDGTWQTERIADGGGHLRIARHGGTIAFTNYNPATQTMRVEFRPE